MDKLFDFLGIEYTCPEDNEINDAKHAADPEFTCPICLDSHESGIKINDCKHQFCKECLKNYIITRNEGTVVCPFKSNELDCDKRLSDTEVRSVLTKEQFVKLKEQFLKQYEASIENVFHCKSLNCIGFCPPDKVKRYEERTIPADRRLYYSIEERRNKNAKIFECPVCDEMNCVDCSIIHKNQTCNTYKAELKRLEANKEKEQEELDALEDLVKSGDIMRCPRCKILVQRRDGMCQYIRCFFCKMDICWLTRGPRWGPAGKGDISGGCKCGVDGKRCHPECRNCH